MKRYFILIAILLIPLVPLGLYALGIIKRAPREPRPVPLTMWVVTEDPSAYRGVLDQYRQIRPYIRVNVVQVSPEDYTAKLKEAWARGKGPDVFALPSTAIGEFADDFLLPMPASTRIYTYQTRKIFFRRETEIKQTNVVSITIPQLRRDFVDVVSDDVIRNDKIYGLPLAIDTLVLYYNRDILRGANIVEPPKTWSQLVNLAPKLTIADEEGKIVRSGIALGTGTNVRYAPDIISLLFLQNGMALNLPDGTVPLDSSLASDGTNLGENALSFYTSFANAARATYSWNADMPESREAFLRGNAALYVGYGFDKPDIEGQSSVNVGVAPILHLQSDGTDAFTSTGGGSLQVNYGNYWVYSVFQRTAYSNEAWNFVQFMSREQPAGAFLTATKRVSALRRLLTKQAEDPDLGVFASQAVSARSWYHGRDATKTNEYLNAMLDNAAVGKSTPAEALSLARRQIELTTLGKF